MAADRSDLPSDDRTANRKPKRAIVLSGGGARGAYEAGVLRFILDELPKRLEARLHRTALPACDLRPVFPHPRAQLPLGETGKQSSLPNQQPARHSRPILPYGL